MRMLNVQCLKPDWNIMLNIAAAVLASKSVTYISQPVRCIIIDALADHKIYFHKVKKAVVKFCRAA